MDNSNVSESSIYHKDGEVIFEEQSTGKDMYIIEAGEVEISQKIGGQKVVIAVFGKGEFFGEMAMFTDAPRSATAIAIGNVALRPYSRDTILQLIQSNLQFAISILQTLISRLRRTTSSLVLMRDLISRK